MARTGDATGQAKEIHVRAKGNAEEEDSMLAKKKKNNILTTSLRFSELVVNML